MTKLIGVIPALPVRSTQAAVDFYRDKLGFHPFYQEDSFARIRRADVELMLWEASDEAWQDRHGETPFKAVVSGAESFLAGTASCRIEVQGIAGLFAEYEEKGVLHPNEPAVKTEWWGDLDFHTVDLDGNLLTFFERG